MDDLRDARAELDVGARSSAVNPRRQHSALDYLSPAEMGTQSGLTPSTFPGEDHRLSQCTSDKKALSRQVNARCASYSSCWFDRVPEELPRCDDECALFSFGRRDLLALQVAPNLRAGGRLRRS